MRVTIEIETGLQEADVEQFLQARGAHNGIRGVCEDLLQTETEQFLMRRDHRTRFIEQQRRAEIEAAEAKARKEAELEGKIRETARDELQKAFPENLLPGVPTPPSSSEEESNEQ